MNIELPCDRCGNPVVFATAGEGEIPAHSWADEVLRPLCSDCFEQDETAWLERNGESR